MSGISSLSIAVSGLKASELALNTTAHNLANVNTKGYVRQQVVLAESGYITIGSNGTTSLSVGYGTDVQTIRQVRDIFLDQSYREESGRSGFYEAAAIAIEEIETILGEIEGESFSNVLDELWTSLNELSKDPGGLETRGTFIESAVAFVERTNTIMEQFDDYQTNLNAEIILKVDRINEIGEEINNLNQAIASAEISGSNANDYRDARNTLLDELSELVDVRYREDQYSNLLISIENVEFVVKGDYREMDTRQAEAFSELIVPGWVHLDQEVFNFDNPIDADSDNDIGMLKGMVLARGTRSTNYTDLSSADVYTNELEESAIMIAQSQFDNLVHGIVTMINDVVAPNTSTSPAYLDTANAPYGLDGSQGVEIFSRTSMTRYDASSTPVAGAYNEEDSSNPYSLYSAGNLMINPDVLANYNLICISAEEGADGDSSVIADILAKWDEDFLTLEPGATASMNFTDYYAGFIGNIGNLGSVAKSQMENQDLMAQQIDSQRSSLMGVSSDEELTNMMKYQHAYNASARVVTVVDEMIEQIVTSLGLVGR